MASPSLPKKKKVRSFSNEWLLKHPWLTRSSNGGMRCNLCVEAKVSNPFTADEGCLNFQHSTLVRHEESRSHIDAVLKQNLRKQLIRCKQNAIKKSEIEHTEILNNYIKQLRTVYVLVKRDISADAFTDIMQLQILNGVKCDHFYRKAEIVSEFEECIEGILEKDLIDKIKGSEFIGIMLDETCDITVDKKLAIYVKYVHDGVSKISFIGNKKITDSTALGIENALIDFLTEKEISDENMSRVYGLGTDGAAVMLGRVNGLGARLQRRNQQLIQVHCIAHRLNLAVSQAAKTIEYCQTYNDRLHTLYRFYSDSSVRYDKLRELQTLMSGKRKQITEPTSVRWLSIETVVKTVFESYSAILLSLESDKEAGKADALLKFLGNSLFLLMTALLIDVLSVIGVLSLTFQSDNVNFSSIKHSVTSTKATILAMKEGSSRVNETLSNLGDVPPIGEKSNFKGVDITDNEGLRHRFKKIRETYLSNLVEKLDDRFPDDQLDILQCLDVVLNPSRYPEGLTGLNTYGCNELNVLCDHFNVEIDRERAQGVFLQFKHLVHSYKNVLRFDSFARVLLSDFTQQYTDFVVLAKIALVIPVSSAPCERGFSVQNAIKSKSRNRLLPERLNRLMFIKLVGPNIEEFDFEAAAKMFQHMKERR